MTPDTHNTTEVEQKTSWRDTVIMLIQALLIVVFVRTFIVQPVKIPSGSMRPTLLVGDYLFISKSAYGYSKYSFPFSLNLFSGRIMESKPKRGDIAVFRLPSDTSVDYIKRVIGLPGDSIQLKDGLVYINDEPIIRERLPNITNKDITDMYEPVAMYKETLPNGVSYNTINVFPKSLANNTTKFVVPEGHYFVLGDNRDNSLDSRFDVGYVPFENFIGKANLIFFSLKDEAYAWEVWKWPFSIRYSRLFSWVTSLPYDKHN